MTDAAALIDLVLDDVVAAIRLGRSVLQQAALQGHGDVLRFLLHRISSSSDRPPSPVEPELSKALSAALLGAAQQGHPQCLSALLESCACSPSVDGLLDARNQLGQTALMLTAKGGRGDCVKILLQQSPETQVAATDRRGNIALMLAACGGHTQCVSQLLQHSPGTQVAAANGRGDSALIKAACGGHVECISELLQHNPQAQVAAANKGGRTALMDAAEGGHAECVGQLLQHSPGTQVAAVNREGSSALILAVEDGHTECVEQLLQHSPEAQLAGRRGFSALLAAAWNNHPGCMALLLAHSPSTQIATLDGFGRPVVETAARRGQPQCLDLLLAHDPPPQHLDAAWLAALRQWDATQPRTSPHTQCLERLVAAGALLPSSAQEADKAKNRLFIKEVGSRALVPDRANEAMVGLAMSVRGKKRKAGQGEEEA